MIIIRNSDKMWKDWEYKKKEIIVRIDRSISHIMGMFQNENIPINHEQLVIWCELVSNLEDDMERFSKEIHELAIRTHNNIINSKNKVEDTDMSEIKCERCGFFLIWKEAWPYIFGEKKPVMCDNCKDLLSGILAGEVDTF